VRFARWQRQVRYWERIAAPPSRAWCALVVLCTSYLLVATSNPAFLADVDFAYFEAYALRVVNVCAIGVVLFAGCRSVRTGYARNHMRAQLAEWLPADNRRRRRVIGVCAVVGASLLIPWTLWIRFELSRPAFERAAQQQLAIGLGTFEPRWVGLYRVSGIFLYPRGLVMLDTSWVSHEKRKYTERVGFYYVLPEPSPPDNSGARSAHWELCR